MGYPPGAGPEAAAFGAVPMTVATVSAPAAAAAARPSKVDVSASVRSGLLVAQLGPALASGLGWRVTRVGIRASEWSTCRMMTGPDLAAALAAPYDSISYSGDGDEYDANEAVYVPPGHSLFLVWGTASGTASARVTYEDVI